MNVKRFKIVSVLAIVFSMLLSFVMPLLSNAADAPVIGGKYKIEVKLSSGAAYQKYGGYPLLHYSSVSNAYKAVTCDMVGYYDDDDNFYPAYCLDVDLDGAEYGSYSVTCTKAVTNNYVYTVILNGYGYNSASDLGCDTAFDAFVATKMAVYTVLYGYDVNTKWKSTGTSSSDKLVAAIKKLVNLAYNSTQSYTDPDVSAKASGDIFEQTIDEKEYYVQKYVVSADLKIASYTISLSGFPDGTVVYNSDFSSTLSGTVSPSSTSDTIYVCIPKSNFTDDNVEDKSFKGAITFKNIKVKSYPILYGAASSSSKQNYALVTDPYEYSSKSATLSMSVPTVVVDKIERDTDTHLAGAEYDIINTETGETVRHVTTGDDGTVTIEDLAVGTYKAVETVAPEGYNLDSDEQEFTVELSTSGSSSTVTITSSDTPITSTVTVNKVASDDSEITGDSAGDGLSGARFNIYDINHNLLLEDLETDENGQITNVVLRYGQYIVEEIRPAEFYLLNSEEESNQQIINVYQDGEQISLTFENEPVSIALLIEKTGIVQCQPYDEITYDFPTLKNDSNVALDNFTWSDTLPTDYEKITKLYTGTYSQDLNYSVWYKLNTDDEWIQYMNSDSEDGTYNTQTNNYINFSQVQTDDEYIVEFKIEFGTVEAGFTAVETPFIFCKVGDVSATDKWTNHTFLTGNYTSIDGNTLDLGSKDDWTTTSYSAELSISKLPKTGN